MSVSSIFELFESPFQESDNFEVSRFPGVESLSLTSFFVALDVLSAEISATFFNNLFTSDAVTLQYTYTILVSTVSFAALYAFISLSAKYFVDSSVKPFTLLPLLHP